MRRTAGPDVGMRCTPVRFLLVAFLASLTSASFTQPSAVPWTRRASSFFRLHLRVSMSDSASSDPRLYDQAASTTAAFAAIVKEETAKEIMASLEVAGARQGNGENLVDRYRANLATDAAEDAKSGSSHSISDPAAVAWALRVSNTTTRQESRDQRAAVAWAKRLNNSISRQHLPSDGASVTAAFAAHLKQEVIVEKAAAAMDVAGDRALLVSRYRASAGIAELSDGASMTAVFAALVKEEAAKEAMEAAIRAEEAADAHARLLNRYREQLRHQFYAAPTWVHAAAAAVLLLRASHQLESRG